MSSEVEIKPLVPAHMRLRFVASLIDGFIISIFASTLNSIVGLERLLTPQGGVGIGYHQVIRSFFPYILLNYLVLVCYDGLLVWKLQASIGKKIVGIKVLNFNDRQGLDIFSSFKRAGFFYGSVYLYVWTFWIFSPKLGLNSIILLIAVGIALYLILVFLDYVFPLFSADGRRVSDRVAGSIVLQSSDKASFMLMRYAIAGLSGVIILISIIGLFFGVSKIPSSYYEEAGKIDKEIVTIYSSILADELNVDPQSSSASNQVSFEVFLDAIESNQLYILTNFKVDNKLRLIDETVPGKYEGSLKVTNGVGTCVIEPNSEGLFVSTCGSFSEFIKSKESLK